MLSKSHETFSSGSFAHRMFLQPRWVVIALVICGTAVAGVVYYWSRRRAWLQNTTRQLNNQLAHQETEAAARQAERETQLRELEEQKASIVNRIAATLTPTTATADTADTDEENDDDDFASDDDDDSTEASVVDFVYSMQQALAS